MREMPIKLKRDLAAVRRRLFLRAFGQGWIICTCVILLLLAIAMALFAELHFRGSAKSLVDAELQHRLILLAAGLAGGLVVAFLWALIRRTDSVKAGAVLDRELHLKDRITTFLQLDPELAATPFGQAFLDDLDQCTQELDVSQAVPLKISKRWFQVPVCLLICLAVLFFCEKPSSSGAPGEQPLMLSQADKVELEKKLTELKKKVVQSKKATKALPPEDVKEMEEIMKRLGERRAKDSGRSKGNAQGHDRTG